MEDIHTGSEGYDELGCGDDEDSFAHQDAPGDGFDDTEVSESSNITKRSTPRRNFSGHSRNQSRQPSAATVCMRETSGIMFVWQTAGVKDVLGEELYEGEAYHLVASIRDKPDLVGRTVGVTRCRLTPIGR